MFWNKKLVKQKPFLCAFEESYCKIFIFFEQNFLFLMQEKFVSLRCICTCCLLPYWEETFLEYSKLGLEYCSNIPEILLKYSRNIPMSEFFRTQICNIFGILPQYFCNISGMFQEYFSNISGIFHLKFYHRNQKHALFIFRAKVNID